MTFDLKNRNLFIKDLIFCKKKNDLKLQCLAENLFEKKYHIKYNITIYPKNFIFL